MRASQMVLVVKNPPSNAGDIGDAGSIPGWERSPRWGNGNPLQYSCFGKSHGQRSLAGYSPWHHGRVRHCRVSEHSTCINKIDQPNNSVIGMMPFPDLLNEYSYGIWTFMYMCMGIPTFTTMSIYFYIHLCIFYVICISSPCLSTWLWCQSIVQ